ncbi:MAG: ankyrin repeat domain-containing protein [Nitrospirota bacterium]|nr:ankyrin repeat domain-containing protein [Nitrospirota bacterium]MDE3223782.1 ankyrin repeat domain-containing protein [Nitrospirota bacterium]
MKPAHRLVAGTWLLGLALTVGTLPGCMSALQDAAERGDLQVVRTLVEQGAPINERSSVNAPPLQNAAAQGHAEVVTFLLDHGADINAGQGWFTPLAAAAAGGHLDIVKLLLDRGADIDAKSPAIGYTALWWAAWTGKTKVVQLLLDRGANCCETAGGELTSVNTPLKAAQDHGHDGIVRLIQQAEARQFGVASPAAASPAPPTAATVPASDVDVPSVERTAKPNRYAVVVGIEQYRTKLPKADFAAHDAQTMKDYLTKTMGFSDENVALLVNENATGRDLEKYIEHWLPNRVEKDGTVFVYYSGHGAPNPKTGDAYLVPYDGDPAFVEATGYPLKRLYEHLGKLPAKEVVVLLDSCFSGAGGRSVIAKGMRPMVLSVENPVLAGGKTVVLAASKGDQVSSTYDQKGHGLLTYFFLKGLRGEADANKDGSVDLAEVYDYLKPQVERTARREYNNDQQPQLLGNPTIPAKSIRLVEPAR